MHHETLLRSSASARLFLLAVIVLAAAVFIGGCAPSEETEQDQTTNAQPVVEKKVEPPPSPVEKAPVKTEETTPQETVKETPKPAAQEPPPAETVTNSAPSGKFSVQIGAYSMPDKAAQIASIARSRFSKRVYTMRDEKNNNTKVLVGDFDVKDDARRFRDQIIQQFPEDYKGAWVFDTSK